MTGSKVAGGTVDLAGGARPPFAPPLGYGPGRNAVITECCSQSSTQYLQLSRPTDKTVAMSNDRYTITR